MSGSGGASGYEYQACAIAYVYIHMLTARRLGWLPSHNDVPVEVRAETIGPGEDIQIRLKDDVVVEVQAKINAQSSDEFWKSMEKLITGLGKPVNAAMHGIVLTDSAASSTVRQDLRNALPHIGDGTDHTQ